MVITTRQPSDMERLTISVTGTDRGMMFSELGDELGRILPTTGDLASTEEFSLEAGTLPDLTAELLQVIQEGVQEGIVHTLWQCTYVKAMPGDRCKLYVLTHAEDIDALVEPTLIATKWYSTSFDETLEVVLRLPVTLG